VRDDELPPAGGGALPDRAAQRARAVLDDAIGDQRAIAPERAGAEVGDDRRGDRRERGQRLRLVVGAAARAVLDVVVGEEVGEPVGRGAARGGEQLRLEAGGGGAGGGGGHGPRLSSRRRGAPARRR